LLRKAKTPPVSTTSTPRDAAKMRQNFPPEPPDRAESSIFNDDRSADPMEELMLLTKKSLEKAASP
jgi:hypothetical protein